ncbi:uncharacterized protein LOC125224846 isoform X3 [Leguminivora glycinivorella]|uniref:uncharacterized protein LOC125224846 isoform X3 n=1 Tax=Leguminivora glycinivorella TaxID=1035111 RepID=UPI00200E5A96|nr:uncharacterized protein LOC125224846 isoform X3 [Leguminivora glycinivorella]
MTASLTIKTQIWCLVGVVTVVMGAVVGLNGDHVCVVQQKYNITKRVKYRAPMSVRTYEWCFSMPPRCSKWSTEMRDLTRLETEERTAEVAVCCPGYKMKDVSCVPICPAGRTGSGCSEEPEHITAVMDKPDRSSVDLISVISIAGGVMMTVITVAVVIVMLERCRRPRYEDKMNSIRMEVMIDNNDGPPPYVRNIFNTPLPEPPRAEKCHYQPISTLDRNLKQFMRPVVVQTISPMMLENFRGILECHYDHLPRRSVEYPTLQARCSAAPSLSGCDELRQQRPDSLAESTIEALKCEAKLDVIDNTTSEPLYAEIPCWRPPSEHAIEVVNLNGEAVTEL